jgi:hypothetical protein
VYAGPPELDSDGVRVSGYELGADADAGVPEVARARTGGAVTTTVADVDAGVASSGLSASDALVVSAPRALAAMSTVIWILPSELPGAMGGKVPEVHVSSVSPADKAQSQPAGVIAEVENVSPVGRFTASVGPLYV